ncbi:polycomb group protein Psc-like [Daphnia carinata]|uniref:polycomb group protein Psc-like n=1 Tax=Daphnia carinata TaxID=120202 RepID=UPI00257AA405|nr:polycomb group protein Psc-like [Daphnia carinata]
MNESTGDVKPNVGDVNCHLICTVCQGYLIDATTITECLHSFCRSCVVPHVAEFHQCPSCSVPLSTTKPFSQLRRDYTLQSIVYKMIPRLARNELERRRTFRMERVATDDNKTEECYLQSFYAPNDPISMSLEYAEPNCEFGLKANLGKDGPEAGSQHRRYFRCPADLPIGHLIKFLRNKFNVTDPATHKLEILYNGRPLASEYKLSDVAYIFSWKEREPLRLWYRISPSLIKEEEQREEMKKGNQRASLVDITSKRSWQCNGKDERLAKRRKRPSAQKKKMESVDPVKTIFDEARTTEFSCSTPIPPVETCEPTESNKIQNWLPKAIFDLDDRALFAKRLQRITNPSEFRPEEIAPPSKEEPPVVDKDAQLIPLRICVTPPSASGHANPEDEIHDSIGALDLSGSKGDSSDASSPLSAGSCRSSASPVGSASKVGPHPYFMTPSAVYHHVQQQDPAQSMAALAAAAQQSKRNSSRSEDDVHKAWDLFHIRPSTAHSSQPATHQSLLNLLKSKQK